MPTATEMLDLYIAAEQAVLKGQSFRFGERQLTRADLVEIRKGRQEWQRTVAAEQTRSAGGTPGVLIADFSGQRGSCSFRRAS